MEKLVFTLILSIVLLSSNSFAGKKPDKEVQKAFELRMNGKVDEAKALLEEVLAKDSTNAMAWYEMARINQYIAVGGGGMQLEGLIKCVNHAVDYDPTNVIYAYYKGIAYFLNAFLAMQTGQGEVKTRINQTSVQFNKVLALKPDYYEAKLYLVEIFGLLPQDLGGDSAIAATYAWKLGSMDSYFGAKALAVIAPEGTDLVKYWEDLLLKNGQDSRFLIETGKACLQKDDPVNAEKYFEKAIRLDPSKAILIVDLARYYIMKVMQNMELAKVDLPIAKTYLENYLKTLPAPVVPLKAYTYGLLARIETALGNQKEGESLMAEAASLDKYFSKASGIPTLLLFDPPGQISHHYFSFFSPF